MARFKVGDNVECYFGRFVVTDIRTHEEADGPRQAKDGQTLRVAWLDDERRLSPIPWYHGGLFTLIAPPKHRVVLEIEDPSALKALTGATIVSDTVI